MALVTVMPNGVTVGSPRYGPMPENMPKRGKIQGWSRKTTNRLRRWFFTVDGEALDGQPHALTLTVKKMPPSAEDWTRTHQNYFKRLRREGIVRGQWLTEFQGRGTPHLHGITFFEDEASGIQKLLEDHWLEVAAEWQPHIKGQHVKPLHKLVGWLEYQAKHSARGVHHYQRANVPMAWRERTGRMWGVLGDWPTREERLAVDTESHWRYRRLLRSWFIAEARKRGETYRAAALRRMLRDPDRRRSAVRGVSGFVPEEVARELLLIATYGEIIESLPETEVHDRDRSFALETPSGLLIPG